MNKIQRAKKSGMVRFFFAYGYKKNAPVVKSKNHVFNIIGSLPHERYEYTRLPVVFAERKRHRIVDNTRYATIETTTVMKKKKLMLGELLIGCVGSIVVVESSFGSGFKTSSYNAYVNTPKTSSVAIPPNTTKP